MVAHPELRKDVNNVKTTAQQKIDYINSLDLAEIQQLAQTKYPELLKEVTEDKDPEEGLNFIRTIIEEHNKTGRFGGKVHTRFPPEPNGWLHIGHACSILMNHKIAMDYDGIFNFRFDDTNPITEEESYVNAMIEDIKWLGVYKDYEDGSNNIFFGSGYFDQFYEYAEQLVKKGLAYIDDSTAEEIKAKRGSITEHGKESPFRNRTIEENLDLFKRMKNCEFPDGAKVLRAKIDMTHPNLLMRDPIIYRILHAPHHNTGDKWCIYPMYDWAHGLEDSIEGITQSICTLEFEVHRPLYDWFLNQLDDEEGNPIFHPQQIEFAKVNLSHTVLGKRVMIQLVNDGHVDGWDDPRMLTISGLRRRGVTAEALRKFMETIGVSKRDKIIDQSILDHCIREDLNKKCPRVMSVLKPLKVVITNYPEEKSEEIEVQNHPTIKEMGSRTVIFSNTIYIEHDDFMENPPKDYYRLSPGERVRLKNAYIIKCENVIKDEKTGDVIEVQCTYEPKDDENTTEDSKKVKGTLHWISNDNYVEAEVRLIDRLFVKENPMDVEEGKVFTEYLNPNSLEVTQAFVEPFLKEVKLGTRFQFERLGYFYLEPIDSSAKSLVFNRIISLRDSWAKES
ncbi:MAG: glutamine--tRNA ligase/YqeY domain fusion protein [Candidatus Heimdallarchaeota archaeon]|nr:glutamine--tRNA ligase/YqeY domain fusion protein [Candidatus Heimdallarchaeota archaeon]